MGSLTYKHLIGVASVEELFNHVDSAIRDTELWTVVDEEADDSFPSKVYYSPGRNLGEDIYLKMDYVTTLSQLRFFVSESWDAGTNTGDNVIGGLAFKNPSPITPFTAFIFVDPEHLVLVQKLVDAYNIAYVGSLFGFATQSTIFWPSCVINLGADTAWKTAPSGKILRVPISATPPYQTGYDQDIDCILPDYPEVAAPSSWTEKWVVSHIPVVSAYAVAGILVNAVYAYNCGAETVLPVGPYEFRAFPIGGSPSGTQFVAFRCE